MVACGFDNFELGGFELEHDLQKSFHSLLDALLSLHLVGEDLPRRLQNSGENSAVDCLVNEAENVLQFLLELLVFEPTAEEAHFYLKLPFE